MPSGVNKFGKLRNLKNESDVEQNFIVRLLDDIGFTEDYRETKTTLRSEKIDKGKKRRSYAPDYVGYLDKGHKFPVLIVDAKSPKEDALDGVTDAQLYASVIRRGLSDPKPIQVCVGSNGHFTVLQPYDSDTQLLRLSFDDFQNGNVKFDRLKKLISRDALRITSERQHAEAKPWKPTVPSVEEIKATFQKCHNRIWKRESLLPTAAFYEFTKLIFLKLREDERLHRIMAKGKKVQMKDLNFHTE